MTIDQMLSLKPGFRVTDSRRGGGLRLSCTVSTWVSPSGVRLGLAITPDDAGQEPCYVLHGAPGVTLAAIADRLTILRQEKKPCP